MLNRKPAEDRKAHMVADGSITPDLAPKDAAVLLTSLVQGIAIRWSLVSRGFALEAEGTRLLEVQLALFACRGVPT